MGQANSPLLSKFGVSMHWNTTSSSKLNYTRKLNEDIFLNMFLPFFFKRTFLNHKTFEKLLKESSQKRLRSRFFSSTVFFSRLWLLRYQSHVILAFCTYNTNSNTLKQKQGLQLNLHNEPTKVISCKFSNISNYRIF